MLLSKNHKRCVEMSKTPRYLRKWGESNTLVPFFIILNISKSYILRLLKKTLSQIYKL